MKNAITYLRVSTQRQGASGFGGSRRNAPLVETFCGARGYRVVKEFLEIESGRHSDRPGLRDALARAKSSRALLVIAKLDRLARNVEFIARLMNAGVEFVAVDFPQANPLTLHILAAVAEAEARSTSERTKAALAAARARGVVLGNPATRQRSSGRRMAQRLISSSGRPTSFAGSSDRGGRP